MSVVVFAIVASFVLTTQQPPPPTIAEFAPQAVERIEEAPNEQSSSFGQGDGDCPPGTVDCEFVPGGGGAAPTPAPQPPVIDVARVRRCVGDPPRQIEDPQSPPCVPYWEGDNGGATAKGVTGSQINLVGAFPPNMVAFLNQRFEFYGRKLVVTARSTGTPNPDCAADGRAAAEADAALQPFATSLYFGSCLASYMDAAAQKGFIHVASHQAPAPESYLSARAPYIWSYQMAFEDLQRTFAAWACDRLKGRVASHAGPGSLNQPRVYGLVYRDADQSMPKDTGALDRSLRDCGIPIAVVAEPPADDAGSSGPADYTNIVLNLKQREVTTVFLLIGRQDMAGLFEAADRQQYYPEWLVTSMYWNDYNWSIRNLGGSVGQKARMFGITVRPMLRQFHDKPSTWANAPATETQGGGIGADQDYHTLLLLASGIQMAGPNLTPQTFEEGLHRTTFPNPDHPIMAGHVGFGGGSHAMTIDAAEFWWSNTAAGPYRDEQAGGGAWCYVDGGARHSLRNRWPAGDPFFQGPCDSGNQPAD